MKKFKNISFHPQLATILDVFFGLVVAWWIPRVPSGWFLLVWFLIRLIWWAFLVRMVYYSPGLKRINHWISLFIFHCGVTSWLLFIDWMWSWYLVLFLIVVLPALSFLLLPVVKTDLSFVGKPHRRFRLLLCMLGLAGIWSGVGALVVYNIYAVSSWVWIVSAAILTAFLGVFWWRQYEIEFKPNLWLWTLGGLVLVGQFAFVELMLPTGYLVNGFLMVWLWYIYWLVGRFQLSEEGINWKKQAWFLGMNAAGFALILLLVVKWK